MGNESLPPTTVDLVACDISATNIYPPNDMAKANSIFNTDSNETKNYKKKKRQERALEIRRTTDILYNSDE